MRSALLAVFALASASFAQNYKFTEYSLPAGSIGIPIVLVRSLAIGPDGSVWFPETAANRIGRISPNGWLSELPLPWPDSHPLGLAISAAGEVWFTEYYGDRLGYITGQGDVKEVQAGRAGAFPAGITRGADGALWFTQTGGPETPGAPCPCYGGVGRVSPTGEVVDFPLPLAIATGIAAGPGDLVTVVQTRETGLALIRPDGTLLAKTAQGGSFVAAAPDGSVWASTGRPGGGFLRIGADLKVSSIPVPDYAPLAFTFAPDGVLWFLDTGRNSVVRRDPDGTLRQFSLPTADSFPIDVAAAPDGSIWVLEARASKLTRLRPEAAITRRVIPAVASSPGLNGTYFRTEASFFNPGSAPTTLTLTFRCSTPECPDRTRSLTVPGSSTLRFADLLEELFGAAGTSGALEIGDPFDAPPCAVRARVYTAAADGGTYGAALPVQNPTDARSRSVLIGLPATGPELGSGFRTNAGAYNPSDATTQVTFTLLDSVGSPLGSTTISVEGHRTFQLPRNVFEAVGSTSRDAAVALVVTSMFPVLPFAIVIDNRSGDSVFVTHDAYPSP